MKSQSTIYLDSCFIKEDSKIIENLLEGYDTWQQDEKDDSKKEEAINLDDVLELLVADLDIFSLLYQLPKVTIKNDEWDIFFQTLFSYYQKLKIDHFFLEDMESLNRYAISKAMIDQEEVSLSTYIESLQYLDSDVLYPSNLRKIKSILQKEFPHTSSKKTKTWSNKKSKKDLKIVMEDIKECDLLGEEMIKESFRTLGYQVVDGKAPTTYEKTASIYQLDPKAKSFIKKNEI